MSERELRAPLTRVRGLGSAKDGTHHWWMQRVTAIALVPLVVWFVASMLSMVGAEHAAALEERETAQRDEVEHVRREHGEALAETQARHDGRGHAHGRDIVVFVRSRDGSGAGRTDATGNL